MDSRLKAVAHLELRDRRDQFLRKGLAYTPAWTYNRFAQTQVWPALRYFRDNRPLDAASKSASSKTMKGAFPPSSRESFLIVLALCFMSKRPTSVDPVKVILRTSGLEVISPPISLESPVTTFRTPEGNPARSASTASAKAE